MAHILGYTGPIDAPSSSRDLTSQGYLPDDIIGKTGVEATTRRSCAAPTAPESVERDATGRDIQVLRDRRRRDAGRLAHAHDRHDGPARGARRRSSGAMRRAGIKRGVFIVMNPQTGEVLALVSLPTYDNNLFARGISNKAYQKLLKNPDKPLINHAVQAHYPPGSTYKLVAGTGGLADGKITRDDADRDEGLPDARRDPVLRLEPPRLRALRHLLRLRPLERHVLLPGRRDARHRPARLLGAAVRLRIADRHRPARRGRRGSSRRTSGSSTRSAQPIFPGEVYQAGIGQGYDVVTPDPADQRLRRARQRRQALPAAARPRGRRARRRASSGRSSRPSCTRWTSSRACSGRCATRPRARSTLRHTYNLVDMPIKVAGKSGTAEFGTRDRKGRLPFHSWFVGFVPQEPVQGGLRRRPTRKLVVLAFAYDSRTKGNAATEIVKDFLQLHFGIKKDYRNRDLLERGNFYRSN